MHVVHMNDVPKTPRTSSLFTGEDVTAQPLVPEGGDFTLISKVHRPHFTSPALLLIKSMSHAG